MPDDSNSWRIRVHHALRCAVGAAAIAAIALTTGVTSGCIPSLLFFISTIAGTPENLQGFQLRSACFTYVGALFGVLSYAAVAAVTSGSNIATFFAAVPVIFFFSSLRAEKDLTPMPAVANVYLGFLLISRFSHARRDIPRFLASFVAEASIAWAMANLVNFIVPTDRAGPIGRRIVAHELRRMGAVISDVGTRTFASPAPHPAARSLPSAANISDSFRKPNDFTLFLAEGLEENAANAGLADDDFVFLTRNLPNNARITSGRSHIRSSDMIRTTEHSLLFMKDLRPFGHTRVSDYASLARAAQLFDASAYEPQLLPEAASHWRNVRAWKQVIHNMQAVVNKVSSLESIVCMGKRGSHVRFSEQFLVRFFGEAYLPLWMSHFASLAASCSKMSSVMCRATCDELFSLSIANQGSSSTGEAKSSQNDKVLDWAIDPRRWNARREDMYFGFLLRYRLALRSVAREGIKGTQLESDDDRRGTMETPNNLRGGNGLESDNDLKAKPIRRSFSISDLKSFSQSPKKFDSDAFEANSAAVKSKVEVQALSYFALTSHALSEEIGHVQQAMVELAATSDARGLLAPFYFVVSGLPPLWRRIKALAKGNVRGWEIKFACTHSMLLTSILALSLFLPISRIEESEIAWVYTSAALAAQLSAEPTLFIGTIRVLATITGAGIGFGFTSILDAMGRSDHSAIQYLAIPYMFIMTIVCLLLVPPAYRYAAFLVIATNAIIIFCLRSTPECTRVLEKQSESCFPDWKYALSRSTNVALGVVFAVFFHLIFWPRYANQVALRYLSAAFLSSSRLFGKLHRTYFSYGLPSGSGSPDLEPSTSYARGDLLLNEDVYQKDQSVLDEIISKVGCPLADAMLLVKSEADVWQAGPFRLDPLIPRVLSDFVALSVSLVEMASLLGRRPIYSSSYGRSVFEHFIHPMLGVYETIQISLNNLVGITDRTVAGNKEQETRENSFDLHHAITHLARIRGKLRRDAAKRSFEFQKFSAIQLTRRKPCRFSRHGNAADDSYVDLVFQDLGLAKQTRDASYPRARSHNETNRACKTDEQRLCVDDVVLYDAFTFITDTCLSAFVRIAVAVLIDSEANLKRMKERRQEEKSLFAKFKRSLASRGVRRGHQDAP